MNKSFIFCLSELLHLVQATSKLKINIAGYVYWFVANAKNPTMVTFIEFQRLIDMSESSTLDFKTKMYDFKVDKDLVNTAKFIKDIICFSNTIRNEKSYIIIGIEEKDDGTKVFHGIDENIDDAILQDKVKDKVFPRPHFIYYTTEYDSKRFGIIEFPISKYSTPISPSIKIKGLEVGQIYYRHGTTNAEATGLEVIRINDWLRSLPDNHSGTSLSDEIAEQIKKLTSNEGKLSAIISDVFKISKKYNLFELEEFCISEIKGISKKKIDESPEKYKYRVHKVFISPIIIDIEPPPFYKVTANMIKKEMEKSDDFVEFRLLLHFPISEIEEYLNRFSNNPDTSIAKYKIRIRDIFPDKNVKNYPVISYLFEDTFNDLYRSIRQKLIDKLIET